MALGELPAAADGTSPRPCHALHGVRAGLPGPEDARGRGGQLRPGGTPSASRRPLLAWHRWVYGGLAAAAAAVLVVTLAAPVAPGTCRPAGGDRIPKTRCVGRTAAPVPVEPGRAQGAPRAFRWQAIAGRSGTASSCQPGRRPAVGQPAGGGHGRRLAAVRGARAGRLLLAGDRAAGPESASGIARRVFGLVSFEFAAR